MIRRCILRRVREECWETGKLVCEKAPVNGDVPLVSHPLDRNVPRQGKRKRRGDGWCHLRVLCWFPGVVRVIWRGGTFERCSESAEGVGFEPTAEGYSAAVFKTAPFGRSGTPPRRRERRSAANLVFSAASVNRNRRSADGRRSGGRLSQSGARAYVRGARKAPHGSSDVRAVCESPEGPRRSRWLL